MDCDVKNLYESLEYCKGETVLPGLYDQALYVRKADIVTFPKLPAYSTTSLNMAGAGTLEGNFVLASDAKFLSIDLLDTASNLTCASQGEKPSKTFLNTATLKYPGSNAAAVGFCRMANADDLLFVLRMRAGGYRVVGNDMFQTDVNPSQDSGTNVTDASGTTLEIKCTDLSPAPFYKGKLPVVGGTLDCATGEVTTT